MTLKEAIRIVNIYLKTGVFRSVAELRAATKLSLEALKRCLELKKYTKPDDYMPLPGETEE